LRKQAHPTRASRSLNTPDEKDEGTVSERSLAVLMLKDITVVYGEKPALKVRIALNQTRHKTAIIGPTAAGKTQLLNVMAGLTVPKKGGHYDGTPLEKFEPRHFYPNRTCLQQCSF